MTDPALSYDQWLDYGNRSGDYLKDWKDDGEIDVWPHPKAGVAPRWAHSFWTTKKKKVKGGDEETVRRSYRFICHEKDVIKQKQRFRDDDIGRGPLGIVGNGRREYPPQTCPMCLLIEFLRDQVRAGKISWTAPLFEWELDGSDSEVVLVGGFCGLFSRQRNDYTKPQWDEMSRAGIHQDEIFHDNAGCRLDYIMRVVDDGHPEDGIVIASVADSLGRKIQKAYKDRIESSKGSFIPSRDLMCLRWKYDDAKDFSDKYDVVALIEAKASDEVIAALEGELPSINDLVAPGNSAKLRAQMEKHCVVKGIPWDQIFGGVAPDENAPDDVPEEPWDDARKAAEASAAATRQAEAPKPAPAPAPAPAAAPQPAPAASSSAAQEASASADDSYVCDACNADIPAKPGEPPPDTCPKCGSEYDSFTGALTFNALLPVSPTNRPREAAQKPAQPAPAAASAPQPSADQKVAPEDAPPAGRAPGRRRAKS